MRRLLVVGALLVFAVPASAARLPVLASHDWWPVFSPDSNLVAFTNVNGQGRVFTLEVVDVATHKVTTLAQASSQLLPSWSSDSTTIAYQSGGRIWTVGADGSNKHEIHAGLYPAWSPVGRRLAYVDDSALYIDGVKFDDDAITGVPAWAPDGNSIVFLRRDGGIFLLSAGAESNVAAPPGEVRSVVWSPDGRLLAYSTQGYVSVVPPNGASPPRRIAGPFSGIGPLAWAPTSDQLAYTVQGGVELSTDEPTWHSELFVKGAAVGTSFAPGNPHADLLAYAGPNLHCPGHDAIRLYETRQLAGSCTIDGTPAADTIEGTSGSGDVIAAGAGNDTIRVQDHHTDRVDCGPGRDTVWADRTDKLVHCEIVHR
jgi:Tol biopolymer transport system component